MHDIKLIRENPAAFDAGLARRGLEPVSAAILNLDTARRAVATAMQDAQNQRNEASKAIGAAMGRGDKDEAERLKAEVATLRNACPNWNRKTANFPRNWPMPWRAIPISRRMMFPR